MFSFILTETNAWIDNQDLRQVCSHIEFYYKHRHVHKIICYTVTNDHVTLITNEIRLDSQQFRHYQRFESVDSQQYIDRDCLTTIE
jgi:hypothetical protein